MINTSSKKMLNSFAPKVNYKVLWGDSIFRLLGRNPKVVTIYMNPLFYYFKFDIVMLENFFFFNFFWKKN